MAMRIQHRMLDHLAHDAAAWQMGRLHAFPFRQQLACTDFVAHVQRITNAGDVVAELAETQRHEQYRRAPEPGRQPADAFKTQIGHGHQHRGQHHRSGPGKPALPRLAGSEVARRPVRQLAVQVVHRVVQR